MRRTSRAAFGFFLGWAVLTGQGCSRKARLTDAQRATVMPWVSKIETTPQHPLDIKFGDYVALIGYDTTSDKLAPGAAITVTWHFRVLKPVPEGYQLFTHVADADGVSRVNLDAQGPLRNVYLPSMWEKGSYVRDRQTLALPHDWSSPKAVVYLGFWKDQDRLPVTGPKDGQRRARVLIVDVALKPQAVPELHAARATGPIELNGKLDEVAWTKAAGTPNFIHTLTGQNAAPQASTKLLWDDAALYVAFEVADEFLESPFKQNDDHLWEKDTVEVMVDPDGDGKNYFELQVSPGNVHFDTRYDARRVPRPFGHMDWDAGITSGVELRGTLNDATADQGYTVEFAIPWSAFAKGTPAHAPPKPLESWRMNFYVLDQQADGQRAVGWSAPRVGDFHVPSRFGRVVFDGT